jgi:Sulfotransferase family
MAIICRQYGLLFIMTPRTACTAIGDLLCTYYSGEFIPPEDILDSKGFISVQKKHSTLSELIKHKILAPEEAKPLLKIAAVRNPFDSLVSLYFKQRLKYQPLLADPSSWVNRSIGYPEQMHYAQTHTFNEWVFRMSYRKLIKRLLRGRVSMFADYTRGMNVILRYESIERDLKAAFDRARIPWKTDLPKVNRTDERSDRDYRSLYSHLAALTVRLAYAYDLKSYGYQF